MAQRPNGKTRIKLKFWDKKSALIDLGKHLGLFKEDEANNTTFEEVVRRALAVPLDQIPSPMGDEGCHAAPRKRGEE